MEGKNNFVNEGFRYENFKIFKYFNDKKCSLLKKGILSTSVVQILLITLIEIFTLEKNHLYVRIRSTVPNKNS